MVPLTCSTTQSLSSLGFWDQDVYLPSQRHIEWGIINDRPITGLSITTTRDVCSEKFKGMTSLAFLPSEDKCFAYANPYARDNTPAVSSRPLHGIEPFLLLDWRCATFTLKEDMMPSKCLTANTQFDMLISLYLSHYWEWQIYLTISMTRYSPRGGCKIWVATLGWIRTNDHPIISRELKPTELLGRVFCCLSNCHSFYYFNRLSRDAQ